MKKFVFFILFLSPVLNLHTSESVNDSNTIGLKIAPNFLLFSHAREMGGYYERSHLNETFLKLGLDYFFFSKIGIGLHLYVDAFVLKNCLISGFRQ